MGGAVSDDGVQLFKEGRFAEAAAKLQEHLAREPADIAARTHLGAALGQMGRYSEAAEEFLALTRLDPGNALHCYNLGNAYEACGNDLQASGAYEKALQLKPDYQKVREHLSVLTARQKNITGTHVASPPQTVSMNDPQYSQVPAYPLPAFTPAQYTDPKQIPPGMNYQPPVRKSDTPEYVVILALLFVAPLGVYLMWTKTAWSSGAKWAITVVWIVGTLVWVGSLSEQSKTGSSASSGGTTGYPTSSADDSSSRLAMEDWSFQGGEYTSEITGRIRNNTDQTYSYVQVEFNLYDNSGNQVGSTLANVNNLEPHGRWAFKAPVMESNAATARFKGITSW